MLERKLSRLFASDAVHLQDFDIQIVGGQP